MFPELWFRLRKSNKLLLIYVITGKSVRGSEVVGKKKRKSGNGSVGEVKRKHRWR